MKVKRRTSYWLSAVMAVILTLAGCATKDPNSPGEVVKAAYLAANEGQYAEVEKHLSSKTRSKLKLLVFLGGSLEEALNKETKKGTIKKIKIKKVEIQGEEAIVRFKLHFQDGTTKDGEKKLIKEDGEWKISG